MGKKSQKKNTITKEVPKKVSTQKRNEINQLIDSLLTLGFNQSTNTAEQWAQYVEMRSILDRIQSIESVLKIKSTGPKSRSAAIEAFYKWAKECEAQYDGIKISEFAGFDLGLEATKDFNKEELFITVPQKMIIFDERFSFSSLVNEIPMFGTMKNVSLACTLLLEKLNPKSFWKPYIDLLPEKYSTVIYYTVNEMMELKGSNVLAQALNQCKSIARQYAFIQKCVQRGNNDKRDQENVLNGSGVASQTSSALELLTDKFTYDLYCWAVSTVMTRQNIIPCPIPDGDKRTYGRRLVPALIPFWDFANHKDGVVTSAYNSETESLESYTLTDYKKGDQIFIYYGDRSNADFLVHNGFVYPYNKKDCVSIRLGLSNSDELLQERTQLLEQLEIPTTCELKVLPSPDFISPQLLAFVRIFNMNREQLMHWIKSERSNDLLHIDCGLETVLESKAWQFLQIRLSLLLKVFPTTLDDDEIVLAQHTKGQMKLSHIKSMLLQYRILEKCILTNALEYARQKTRA